MNVIKSIIKVLEVLVVALVVVTSLLLVFSNMRTPLNVRVFAVTSGSMEPAIKTGSVVLVKPQDAYQVGDIITYTLGRNTASSFVTHRVIDTAIDTDLGTTNFTTKGDANEDPDTGFISSTQVVGKVQYNVPFLGYLTEFAKTQQGFIALVVIPATLIVFSEVSYIRSEISAGLRDMRDKKKIATADKTNSEEKEEKKKKPSTGSNKAKHTVVRPQKKAGKKA